MSIELHYNYISTFYISFDMIPYCPLLFESSNGPFGNLQFYLAQHQALSSNWKEFNRTSVLLSFAILSFFPRILRRKGKLRKALKLLFVLFKSQSKETQLKSYCNLAIVARFTTSVAASHYQPSACCRAFTYWIPEEFFTNVFRFSLCWMWIIYVLLGHIRGNY